MQLDYATPHQRQAKPFTLPEGLQLGGGPANPSKRALKGMTLQGMQPLGPEMYTLMDEIKAMSQYIFQTRNSFTVAVQTSGNGGNEAILINLLDPGEKLLVAIGGFWGDKIMEMAKRYGIEAVGIRSKPGEIFTYQELEEAMVIHNPKLLFVTHGESTGGTIQKLESLGKICHRHNCLLAVDAVVSTGVDPLLTDLWELDAVNAANQKGLGAPPGISIITLSPMAVSKLLAKKQKPPYYLDLKLSGEFWKCFPNVPSRQHYVFSTNTLAAVREGLAVICEEGLENVWKRHKSNAELLWSLLEELGLEFFVPNPENRFSGVTCVKVPEDIEQMELLNWLEVNYEISITWGVGPTLNKAFRLGLMADNSRKEVVEYVIKAMKEALEYFRK